MARIPARRRLGLAGYRWYELPGGTIAAFGPIAALDGDGLAGGVFLAGKGRWTGGGLGRALRQSYAAADDAMDALARAVASGLSSGLWRPDIHPGWERLHRRRGWCRTAARGEGLVVLQRDGRWTAYVDGVAAWCDGHRQEGQAFADAYVLEGPTPPPQDETRYGLARIEEANLVGYIPMNTLEPIVLTLPRAVTTCTPHRQVYAATASPTELQAALHVAGVNLHLALCTAALAHGVPDAEASSKAAAAKASEAIVTIHALAQRSLALDVPWRPTVECGVFHAGRAVNSACPTLNRGAACPRTLALLDQVLRGELPGGVSRVPELAGVHSTQC